MRIKVPAWAGRPPAPVSSIDLSAPAVSISTGWRYAIKCSGHAEEAATDSPASTLSIQPR
ncbi:hypothetical protein PSAC2689_50008 [Paraburkholderia sacchari]